MGPEPMGRAKPFFSFLSENRSLESSLASVLIEQPDLMILDEPSSALDPNAEYRLNQSITERTKDKTVVFISHRLSTTRMADRIYMFVGGKLAEVGSHSELMAQEGKYAEMFRLQSEKYAS